MAFSVTDYRIKRIKPSWSNTIFMKFTYYFFKIIGLATININFDLIEQEKTNPIFKCTNRDIIYNVVLIGCLSVLSLFSLKTTYFANYEGREKYEIVTETFAAVLNGSISITILIIFCNRQQRAANIAGNIFKIVDLVRNLDTKKCENWSPAHTLKMIYSINSFWWLVISITLILSSGAELMFNSLAILLSNYIINWTMIQYSIALNIISHLFRIINGNFQIIFKNSFRLKNMKCPPRNDTGSAPRTVTDTFSHLRSLYLSLCGISQDISNFYDFPIFLCTLYIFYTSIQNMYYSGKAALFKIDNISLMAFASSWTMVALYIFTLIYLTKSASQTVIEVNIY